MRGRSSKLGIVLLSLVSDNNRRNFFASRLTTFCKAGVAESFSGTGLMVRLTPKCVVAERSMRSKKTKCKPLCRLLRLGLYCKR